MSHRLRAKSAISGFATWLVEEKGLLRRSPTRGVEIPAQPLLAPRRLSPDQRYVLKNLVERDGAVSSAAIFALVYWAGCRVSDVSWLTILLRPAHKGHKGQEASHPGQTLPLPQARVIDRGQDKSQGYPGELGQGIEAPKLEPPRNRERFHDPR